MIDTENQQRISAGNAEALKPYQWKKGQSGNPAGRPKGKSMKEWGRELLERLTDEERFEFLMGMPKDVIWRMVEGNPSEDKKITVTVPRPILAGTTQETLPTPENTEQIRDAVAQEVLEDKTKESEDVAQ